MGAMSTETSMTSTQSPVTLRGATQFDMTSKISGRAYRIFVFQPPSAAPPSGYPVIVMTDGNMSFPAAATLDGMFALQGGKAALVVGVGYPADDAFTPFVQRNRDLTPPTPLSGIRPVPGQPPPKPENYGGSQDFYRFLVEELRPAIAAAYPVDLNDQTLYGHSLGGLFVLGVLFDHPGSFRNFVASSPSIWWNKRAILKSEAAFAGMIKAGAATPRVLILVGAEEQDPPANPPPGMTRPQMKRLLTQARMVDNARELAERLALIKAEPGYSVRFHALDDEDHLTVVPTSISRTLAFALRDDVVRKGSKR
jgi:predicted alpha/beta superfamily hydrolase